MIFTFDLIFLGFCFFVLETFSCTPSGLDGRCGGVEANWWTLGAYSVEAKQCQDTLQSVFDKVQAKSE